MAFLRIARNVALSGASALVLVAPTFAHAQEEPAAADVAAARSLGIEGMRLADAGKCDEAVDKLARAEKTFHAPTTLDRLGECQVQLGKLVEGTENLRKLSRETLAANAPAAFVTAKDRAKAALATAMPRLAKLKVSVVAPPDVTPVVTIDGKTISAATVGSDRPADPGEHVVEATALGYLKARGTTKLEEGGSGAVELKLEVDPSYKAAPAVVTGPTTGTGPTTTPGETTPQPASKPNYTPAIIAASVGGVGLITGVVGGLLALGSKNSLLDLCNQKTSCPPSAKSTYDSASTEATISTVGFVVGGVGLATAAVLFAVAPTSKPAAAAWQLDVGPTSLGVHGRF